jgi:hypothetical protein
MRTNLVIEIIKTPTGFGVDRRHEGVVGAIEPTENKSHELIFINRLADGNQFRGEPLILVKKLAGVVSFFLAPLRAPRRCCTLDLDVVVNMEVIVTHISVKVSRSTT